MRFPRWWCPSLVASFITLVSLACHDTSAPNDPIVEPPGLRIIESRQFADTIGKVIPTPIRVRVLARGGVPQANVVVFAQVRLARSQFPGGGGSFVSPVMFGTDPYTQTRPLDIRVTTDATGEAKFWVALGQVAGTHQISIEALDLDYRDSVAVRVLPGLPSRFNMTTRDTAVYVGASFGLGIQATDFAGNVVPNALTVVNRRPDRVSLDAAGVVTAQATGRAFVYLSSGAARDSIGVSVVPRGTLVALGAAATQPSRLYLFDLDGSNYRPLGTTTAGPPMWSPDGQHIVFSRPEPATTRFGIYTMDLTGQATEVIPGASAIVEATHPTYSRDGMWIYFDTPGRFGSEIWRTHSDGTGAERVGTAALVAGDNETFPSPSPDGSRFVAIGRYGTLALRNPALNETKYLGVPATFSRWAPTGEEIAYVDGGVKLIRADGTTPSIVANWRSIPPPTGSLDWSPDGAWLVACVQGRFSGDLMVALIEHATGEVLPLPFTARDNLCSASWRP